MLLKSKLFFLLAGLLAFALISQFASAHGMSEAEKQAIIAGGNFSYLRLGATHMLSGYDHLAFVFGIVFFLNNFRDIVKYVTAFTLGHSVTLIFATLNGIRLNYFIIDAVIALSVCYIAFANIDGFRKYLRVNPPNMMLMITGLGLIHGFGLSTRLQELPLSEDSLLLNIISFNVGIELGQIGALAVMLACIVVWRKSESFGAFSRLANYLLIVSGALLFLMQMHGYLHSSSPEEFSQLSGGNQFANEADRPEGSSSSEWKDTISVTIPARGDKEYKLYVEQGQTIEYLWRTDGSALFFDFHGEPDGDTSGYFESFGKSTESESRGSLAAPFSGTHGWYWKNDTSSDVVIVLKVNGSYKLLGE